MVSGRRRYCSGSHGLCFVVLECASEEFYLSTFVYQEPVELSEMWCDVCSAEDESGCRVLDGL